MIWGINFHSETQCFGLNRLGTLGIGSTVKSVSHMGKALVSTPYDSTGKKIKQVFGGMNNLCVLLDDSLTVKCIGNNSNGGLGQGDAISRGDSPSTTLDKIPAINLGTNNLQISSIQLRNSLTCIIFKDNTMKCIGTGLFGALGTGSKFNVGFNSTQMGQNLKFVDVFSTFQPTSSPNPEPQTVPTSSPTQLPTTSPTNSPTPSLRGPCSYPDKKHCKKDRLCDWHHHKCEVHDCNKYTISFTCSQDIRCEWSGFFEVCVAVNCPAQTNSDFCGLYAICVWRHDHCAYTH